MENINSRSIYILASIKVLLLILLTGFSYVAFGAVSNSDFWDAEQPEVIHMEHLEFAGKAHSVTFFKKWMMVLISFLRLENKQFTQIQERLPDSSPIKRNL